MRRMAKRATPPNLVGLLIVIALALIGAYVWLHKRERAPATPPATAAKTPAPADGRDVTIANIDPANDGRVIAASGALRIAKPARDTQLGIEADAVMLLRYAEMLQWRETCAGASCTYQQVWSAQPIDSKRFRAPEGHGNPGRLPVTSARFLAGELRLGAFLIDATPIGNYRLESVLAIKPVPYKVTTSQLPSNLAASFHDANGALYGGDPAHRAVGDLRVSYRIIPAGNVAIIGTQRGERLIVQKSKPNPSS